VRKLVALVLFAACSGPSKPPTVPAPVDPTGPVEPAPSPVAELPVAAPKPSAPVVVMPEVIASAKKALLAKHGDAQRARIERGVSQVAALWRAEDGDLTKFVSEHFLSEPKAIDALFDRLQKQLEQVDGHGLELGRSLRWDTEVDTGAQLPVDSLLAAFDPGAHVTEDLFNAKVAFAALLNFPLTTLESKLKDGEGWTRRQWAESKLTGRFDTRIPGNISAQISAAAAAAALFATAAIAQAASVLTLNLDCGSDQGRVMIAVYDSEAAYNGQGAPVRTAAGAPGQPVRIEGLAPGRYAVKSFHDLNGNGQMDSNPFGMPTEPFAFSNNARGNMGPAPWSAAAFDVDATGATQTLVLK